MKSAIVHVGPHKTGSTYLQACFHRARGQLRAHGVVLPSDWNAAPENSSHTGLIAALASDESASRARAYLDTLFRDGGETLLISAEDLSSLQLAGLTRLRTLLAGTVVTIVYYVRRWSDMLPSGWQERIKHGETISLPEHLIGHVRNPMASHVFNWDLKIRQLVEVFGQDNVRLVSYSILQDMGKDLFSHFAHHFIGWKGASSPLEQPQLNVSRGIREIEVLRRLNMITRQRGGEQSSALRNRLDSVWHSLDTAPLLAAMEQSVRTMGFSDSFPMLRRLHEELHEKYRGNNVAPAMPKYFFKSMASDLAYVSDDFLLLPGMAEAMQRLYDAVMPA